VTDEKNSFPESEGTRIDMGEDLLEQDPHAQLLVPSFEPESIQSLFESAKILVGEGMLEEAKKLVHQVLTRDSKFNAATELLKEIHSKELQQIFNQERSRKIYRSNPDREEIDISSINGHELLEKLDRELNLGVSASPSLFTDRSDMDAFCRKMEKELSGASPQDRVDLGIGFLETGLFELASLLFKTAAQGWGECADPRMVSGIALHAFAQILDQKPFEAVMSLQSVINDPEIPKANKTELFYLMARALDAMEKPQEALNWYKKTAALDPHYRDVPERLKLRKPR